MEKSQHFHIISEITLINQVKVTSQGLLFGIENDFF